MVQWKCIHVSRSARRRDHRRSPLSKVEFEFPVKGATPKGWKETVDSLLSQNRGMEASLKRLQDLVPECHDQNEIAEFVVGLIFAITKHGAKSDAVYAYVRRTVAGKEFLTELASRIIVLYDVETRKRDTAQEVEDVRNAISRVRLD